MMSKMTRREWAIVIAAATRLPVVVGGAVPQGNVDSLRGWASLQVPSGELTNLAREYLSRHPSETAETLEAALLNGRRGKMPLPAYVSTLVRDEFEDGRLENLDGWILTRTEARLLALASL